MELPMMLIADGVESDRMILKEIFNTKFTVLEAGSGKAALEALKQHPEVSVAILDLIMPDMDGFDLLGNICADPQLQNIPFIVTSSCIDDKVEVRALHLGAHDFVSKPYVPEVIYHRVKNITTNVGLQRSVLETMNAASLQLHTLLNNLPGGVSIFEVSDNIENVYINDSLRSLTGYSKQEFDENFFSNIRSLIVDKDYPGLVESFRRCLKENTNNNFSFRIITKSGEFSWVNMRAIKIGMQGNNHLFYSILLDINDEKALEEKNRKFTQELRFQAHHDQLTGIYNRRAFCDKTTWLLKSNPDTKYVVLCWDIHRFKVINDLFGVTTGDNILKTIADYFDKTLSGIGTYCRLEADLFAICLPKKLLDVEQLISDIQNALVTLEINYDVPIYAGIYTVDDITLPVDLMCDRAWLALHAIKGSYIKHYAFYDNQLRNTIMQEQEIISEMSTALENGEFCFYLQPICDMMSDTLISAEALVRWNHPTKGLLYPSDFLPLFERNGFITKLDAYVWEEVARYISQKQAANEPVIPISVNVSRVNMHNPRLCEEIVKLTQSYNIEPSMIKFEITEGAYNDNPRQLIETMKAMQAHGFQMMMDDFGSGYSSLNMLKDVPVNALKIDMRFIDDLETSNRAGNVVTSVVRMAKWLNMLVVAEGVETRAQIDFLRSIGCDCAQGHYYSRPLPTREFERFLADAKMKPLIKSDNTVLENFDLDALLNSSREINLLFNSVIGGLGIYELYEDSLEVVRVNDGYYELTGDTPQTLLRGTRDILSRLFLDDRKPLLEQCRIAERTGKVQEFFMRRYRPDGKLIWLDVKIRYIGQNKGHSLFYFASNNVTVQKETEQKEYLSRYTTALRSIYSEIYELDFTNDTLRTIYLSDEVDSHISDSVAMRGALRQMMLKLNHPDDQSICLSMLDLDAIRSGIITSKNNCFTIEVRIKRSDGEYHWISKTIIQIFNDNSNVFLCCIADIDTRKSAEATIAENRLLEQQA